MALKELTDNALDNGASAKVGALDQEGNAFFVEDDGPGIDGSPEEIARLFSIRRPMVSTKLWRLPTRGALGNGLRVVAALVLIYGGSLRVWTRNWRLDLEPRDDGSTEVVACEVNFPKGTRVEITFGPALPDDGEALSWARLACRMAEGAVTYKGKPSPWWYDGSHFHELLTAADKRLFVRDVVARLDGCSEPKAGAISADFKYTPCNGLTREQAARLLAAARHHARPVKPDRLGTTCPEFQDDYAQVRECGSFVTGTDLPAEIPFVVEAWGRALPASSKHRIKLRACVNRTPVIGDTWAFRDKKEIVIYGCALSEGIRAPQGSYDLLLNVITAYCPITSEGKEPNLKPFAPTIVVALERALKKAQRSAPTEKGASQKELVLAALESGVAKVSGDGEYRFNERQLFYVIRPLVMDKTGKPLTINNFKTIVTDYEAEHGEISGMYRDVRGSISHPHRNEEIPLGTLSVEEYERPPWEFNKLLYIEKEGANEALRAAQWDKRHDCAIMSSKGFSTRAARDLVDKLAQSGDEGEPVTIFCAHDADAFGTLIYQTFQEETKARPRRRFEVINIGLEPWEALAMELQVEDVEEADRRKPVANYIVARGRTWVDWLQRHRVELNAMTTPQLIAWLDSKMAEHGGKKLFHPALLSKQISNAGCKSRRAQQS